MLPNLPDRECSSGKLRYWGEPNAPLLWHFQEEDFDAASGKDFVSFQEASRMIGISPEAVKHAATLGVILGVIVAEKDEPRSLEAPRRPADARQPRLDGRSGRCRFCAIDGGRFRVRAASSS